MYNSYLVSAYIANVTLLLCTKENDYRQGFDYNIMNVHLISILTTYVLFVVLICIYILESISIVKTQWIRIINKSSLISAMSLILSGGFWSWSQWGTVQLYDVKILVTIIIIILFFTADIIIKLSSKPTGILLFYNVYVLYHLPLLKYNVIWNSEIHQKNTFQLLDFFMVNYNSSFVMMLMIAVLLIVANSIITNRKECLVLIQTNKSLII